MRIKKDPELSGVLASDRAKAELRCNCTSSLHERRDDEASLNESTGLGTAPASDQIVALGRVVTVASRGDVV